MERTFKTTCSYCGVGCGIEVTRHGNGRLTLRGDAEHPANQGRLCAKGLNLHHTVADTDDRLQFPLLRGSRAQPLARTTWDRALDRVAATFRALIDRHGPESVAFYVSGQLLTEEYYVANKLMKGFIGSNNIDTNSRLCMSTAVTAYKLALGEDSVPVAYADIERSSCFLIAGANPAWCHPILFQRIEACRHSDPDTRVIVVDPRRTQSCSIADLHLQINPGTDVTCYLALARCLLDGGFVDRPFLARHTEGWDDVARQLAGVDLDRAAATCGVARADLERAAQMIGSAPTFLSLWAMGLNQSAAGVDKNLALLNLSLLTGQIGKPGCGPFSLTGQPNAMGGREVGGLSTMLPAHRDLANPAHRREVAALWGVQQVPAKPGLTATEMFSALEAGTLKAIWIMCTNPVVSMPDVRRAEAALGRARFVVVQDISSRCHSLRWADVVLPAAGWLEKQGTMTNSERRVTHLPKVVEPPGEARPDVWILCDFARRMGWGEAFAYRSEADIFAEHTRLTAGTALDMTGIDYTRLQQAGSIQWPCPAADHPGTERLFTDRRFATASGRARLHAVAEHDPDEPPCADYPFVLTTGRLRDQWHTMTRTGKVAKLGRHERRPFAELHPDDAARLGVREGRTVAIASRYGMVRVPARLSAAIKPGVVFVPMHWGRTDTPRGDAGRANNVTSPRVDPRSKEPDFKYTAVAVRPVVAAPRRVCVVGAGPAALAFVREYRAHNRDDRIQVLSAERELFYNRVLLVEYLAGKRRWPELQLTTAAELAELDLDLHPGAPVTAIDRDRKCVRVASGQEFRYDRLVLATGSRARRLPDLPVAREGVVTLRNREDAHAAMALVTADSRVLIVGGGLLGLELAAALAGQVAAITVLQNRSLLLGRQLDATGSEVLRDALIERGVRLMFNDRVASYSGTPRISGVRTEGGLILDCDLLLVAVGTEPNRELGTAAGLHTRRALVVNSHLQTSDPEIYALGEIAEHNGRLYGTTEHAQEQARVAARHATGDEWAAYADAPPYNVLKIPGTSVSTVGLTAPGDGDDPGDGFEEVTLLDRRMGYYKKCVVRHDRLVGAVLIGDNAEFAAFRRLIETGSELDEQREQLLRPAAAGLPGTPRGRLVCSCHGVGADDLSAAVAAGSATLAELCAATRAGTGCGTCRPEVAAFLAESAGTPRPRVEPSAGTGASTPESSEPMAAAVNPTAALPVLTGPSESAGAAAPRSSDSPPAAPASTTKSVPTLAGQPRGEPAARPEAALA